MESALLLFSEQAGIQILVDARLTENRQSPRVAGYYPAHQVLHRLIDGSELRPRFVARNTVALAGPQPRDRLDQRRAVVAPLSAIAGID